MFRNRIDRLKARGILHCNDDGGEGSGGGGGGVDVEALQAQLNELQKERDRILAKNDELLGEAKKAKQAKTQAEAKAAEEAERIAKEKGDFEQLYKSSESKLKETLEQLNGLQSKIANEKRNSEALKIAATLADGHNAELLSGFIAQRLKYTDDGLKVTDDAGNLTVSSLEDLATEFKNNSRYAALLKGNQSSGGGAAGGSNGSGATTTYTRSDLREMPPAKQAEIAKLAREGKAEIIDS